MTISFLLTLMRKTGFSLGSQYELQYGLLACYPEYTPAVKGFAAHTLVFLLCHKFDCGTSSHLQPSLELLWIYHLVYKAFHITVTKPLLSISASFLSLLKICKLVLLL